MNEKEFKERQESIELERNKKMRKLREDYAKSNQKYSVGDILESDTLGTILVDRVTWGFKDCVSDFTECIYCGDLLRKSDLEPYKSGGGACIYESRIVRKIKAAK